MSNADDLGKLILILSNTIIKNRNRHLEDLRITSAQADSLKYFVANNNTGINDLKDYLGVAHQTAQGIVARMEAKGLVKMETSPSDRRYKTVTVTEAGRTLEARIGDNRHRTGGLLTDGMAEAEAEELFVLLTRAYENVKDDGANRGDQA